MKKLLIGIGVFFGLAIFAQLIGVSFAAPFPTGVGGTGTAATPASGTILIGNGAGSYTPAFLNCSGTCSVSNGSGTITITVTGGSSSGTVFLLTGGHGISLSPASITASGTIAVNTSTVIADVIASGNFLPSSTTYVATVNGQSGAVTIGVPATTTINGQQLSVFHIIGDGTTVTSTVTGSTTTFSVIPNTFYPYGSNPSNYLTGNQTITLKISGDATGTATGATSITNSLTVTGLQGKALPTLATGTLTYTAGAWTFNNNTYLLSGINVTTTAPLGGGGSLTAAGLTLTCATCLTGNQTITLTGAVTGSGATSIATVYTTSTLYGFFSASSPIVYNSSTGVFSWTNSNNYISNISINGNSGTSFQIAAGSGVTSTVSGATTTLTLNLSGGCSGGQFVANITATGTIQCGTPSGGASSTNVYGVSPIVVNQVGVNATTSCPTCQVTTSTVTASGTTLTGPAFTFGSSTTVLPYASGSALYWTILTNGNWTGNWQNATSGTYYPASNPNGFISGYNVYSTNPFLSVSTTTTSAAITFSSSSLNLGSASTHPASDFLASNTVVNTPSTTIPTVFVSTFNGLSGVVTYAPSTTIPTNTNQLTNGAGFITTSTNNFGGLTNASITAQAPITWSGSNVIGFNTSTPMTLSGLYTFLGNILNNGNVTTTNETVSSTLQISHANASGSWNFTIVNDGNYLDIANTGTIPGTNPVPYTIVQEICPPVGTTSTAVSSSSWECDWTQRENLPDGSSDFVDWNSQYYATGSNPSIVSGWFDNARGTSSVLLPFRLSWNDGTNNQVGFQIGPVVATSAISKYMANFNLNTNGQFSVGTNPTSTGAFVVNQNGASTCAGIYDSGASTIYGLTDSLPAPAGCTALGGYYKGLAIGGSTNNLGNPIFGVLNSGQSSNGRGHTAVTVYDTNEVDTFNNTLDDGAGNATVSSTLTTKNLTVTAVTNALHVGGSGGAVTGYAGTSCAAGTAFTGLSASGTPTCTSYAPSSTINPLTSINGVSSSTFHINGTGNITSTLSGASTTFSITGVIPSANGGTATTTALGSNAFNSTAFSTVSTSSLNTWTGPQTFTATTTQSGNLNVSSSQIYEPVFDNGTSTGGTATINWNLSNKQQIGLGTSATTISFSNVQNGASYTLWVEQDGTGSRTVTWPSSGVGQVQWASSTIPTLTTTANNMDVFSFQCFVPHATTTITCFGQYGNGNFIQ